MRNIIVASIAALLTITVVQAKEYRMRLFEPSFVNDGVRDFLTDYRFFTECLIDIDDSAIQPDAFISYDSPAFRSFTCTLNGNDDNYTFAFGSNVPLDSFFNGTLGSPQNQFTLGLLFDGDGEPLRFESPEFSFANGVGFYHDPDPENASVNRASFLGLVDDDDFRVAVLLEPAIIGSTERPIGYTIQADLVPPGTDIALLNGNFSFFEQRFKDTDGDGNFETRVENRKEIRNGSSAGIYSFDEKLSLPKIRVTQAVFENDNTIDLVHERTTAVLLDRGPLFSDRKVTFSIIDEENNEIFSMDKNGNPITEDRFVAIPNSDEKIFICSGENAYCNLKNGPQYIFRIQLDNGNLFEYDLAARIVDTRMLGIEFFLLGINTCGNANIPNCGVIRSVIERSIVGTEQFLQEVFPLEDGGIRIPEKNPDKLIEVNSTPAANQNIVYKLLDNTIFAVKNQLRIDARNIKLLQADTKALPVAIVTDDYFTSIGSSDAVRGKQVGGVAFVRPKTGVDAPYIAAHELGHILGLFPIIIPFFGEDYEINPPEGSPASGFNIYTSMFISNGLSYMGIAESAKPYWSSISDWQQVREELASDLSDPVLMLLSGTISPFGAVTLDPIGLRTGFPERPQNGEYTIVAKDHEGNSLGVHSLDVKFAIEFHGLGIGFSDTGVFSHMVDLPSEAALIEITDKNGLVVESFDPLTKSLIDIFEEMDPDCIAPSSNVTTDGLVLAAQTVAEELEDGNFDISKTELFEIDDIVMSDLVDECQFLGVSNNGVLFKERVKLIIASLYDREGFDPLNQIQDGDIDRDGDVDRDDLNILMASRNQAADGEGDPKDLDGDGRITGLDARKLTQLCTRSRCATE